MITNTKILLVEDNEINIKVALLLLKHLEFSNTIVAKNGQEALALLNEDIELVLLDIGLPDIDGFELSKQIRNNLQKKIPIIAITANFEETKEKCKLFGIDDVVAKPIDIDILDKKIKEHLLKYKPKKIYSKN